MESAALPDACINASHAIINRTYESAPLTVISSVLSMLGSSLVIISYFLWKDLRKSTARTILLFLAMADFMTSIGYFWSAIAYIAIFSNLTNATNYYIAISANDIPYTNYEVICKIESFWDTYFPVVSFFWTANLAIYFVVTLVFLKISFAKKLMIPFHLTAWLIPLIVCVYGISSGWLGPATHTDRGIEDATAGAWCFVSSAPVVNITNSTMYKIGLYYGMEAICGKGIEVIIYFIVIVCYTMIIVFNKCRTNLAIASLNQRTTLHFRTRHYLDISLVNTDLKLLLVPILFICIRSGGTIRFFISSLYDGCRIPVYNRTDDGVCINQRCLNLLYDQGLVDLQAFCDPLQGFVNGIVFVFLTKSISEHLLHCIGTPIKWFIDFASHPVSSCFCCQRKQLAAGYTPVPNSDVVTDEENQDRLEDVTWSYPSS